MNAARPTLIFDLDGTLVDTAADISAVANQVLCNAGRRALSVDEVRRLIGHGLTQLISDAFALTGEPLSKEALQRNTDAALALYRQTPVKDARLYPDVPTVLETLSESGYQLALCTNKPIEVTLPLLAHFGLSRWFNPVVGGGSFPFRKPDGRLITSILDQLNASADAAVVIGDSPTDALLAENAGLPCILLTYGYTAEPLENTSAACLIDHFAALPSALENLLGNGPGRAL